MWLEPLDILQRRRMSTTICKREQMRPASKFLADLPCLSNSSILTFKMCHYFQILPDSVAFGFEASEHEEILAIRQDQGAEDQQPSSIARR